MDDGKGIGVPQDEHVWVFSRAYGEYCRIKAASHFGQMMVVSMVLIGG